jgi:hypothetical protein
MDYEQLLKMYYAVFIQSVEGQEVLKDLSDKFYRPSLINNHNNNVNDILLSVGTREVVVYIMAKIEEFELIQKGQL